ncbi:hypothetical protein ES705_44619 [subsurface metagenome]
MRHLGQLYINLEDYKEAEQWFLKSLDELGGEEEKIAKSLLAHIFVVKGEYKTALYIWKDEQLDYWRGESFQKAPYSIYLVTRQRNAR